MAADRPAYDPDAPALLLSPHLDDAAWAAYAVLTGPGPVVLVNLFAGLPVGRRGWWDEKRGVSDSVAQVRERIAEDAAVMRRLGRDVVNLPLLDDQYRDGPLAVDEALGALGERVEAASRIYAPGGIGGHPDHAYGRDVGLALAARGLPTTIYADFSYSVRLGWPTWVDPAGGRPEADAQWRRALGRVPGIDLRRPRVHRLGRAESDAKHAAMRLYATQYDAIEAEEPRWQVDGRAPSDPELRSVEVYYDLAR